MEESPSLPMVKTCIILRKSIHTFLSHYQYFTNIALLLIPFSASLLLSQPLVPYASILPLIHNRLQALFYAAGFPPSSELFTILSLKLSQTITSSILLLPFTLSFLLIAKVFIIHALNHHHKQSSKLKFCSFISLYTSLLNTQICNSLVIISANATCFSILFIAFNCLQGSDLLSSPTSNLFVTATAAVFYSITLANTLIICNLALVLSGMQKTGGYMSILKACVLIRGRNSTALSLALPLNMALAAIEALFQYRVVGAYYNTPTPTCSMALEWMFIAYLYCIFIVLDTIVSCVFYKSCKTALDVGCQQGRDSYRIEISEFEEQCTSFINVKT
ncbi:Hornerin like [Heracleum sosnowskyi]|uniref:Hornerin like n=1 Tax=Heracleum sosnowskyi TaxID=360622 RepID=A0AAD8HTY9_9APIA|nr:Hornerin like [Heracleum sosnowskyi]